MKPKEISKKKGKYAKAGARANKELYEYNELEREATLLNMTLASEDSEKQLISLSAVPEGFHTQIIKQEGDQIYFHTNLLQYSVQNRAFIFDLDKAREVKAIEGLDKLIDPDKTVTTGFNMQTLIRMEGQDQEVI